MSSIKIVKFRIWIVEYFNVTLLFQMILVIAAIVYLASCETDTKKSIKRGIDDFGLPGGWAAGFKYNPHTAPGVFIPPAHDLSHLVAASKKAAFDVHLAQQYVNAAKEDVLFSQKLVKEKETQALIAHQKSEAAQHSLRSEANNVALAQQKLAKVNIP